MLPDGVAVGVDGGWVKVAAARLLARVLWAVAVSGPLPAVDAPGQVHRIDARRSRLTVFVSKAGLLSAFGHDHVISAPVSRGTISLAASPAVELIVSASDLVVRDPDLDAADRAKVRARMVGADVLDAARYPTIRFASTVIVAAGPNRWNVAGHLTVHGVTRLVTLRVAEVDGVYRGETRIRQRDFGVEPVRLAGGAVGVKDEVTVRFEIAVAAQADTSAAVH